MAVVSTYCPYCLTANSAFEVTKFVLSKHPKVGPKPSSVTHEAIGRCGGCRSYVVLFFYVRPESRAQSFNLPTDAGSINSANFQNSGTNIIFRATLPAPPQVKCPNHVPDKVQKAFTEAENARLAGLFSAAAGHYRKAVDRAITPLLPEKNRKGMLGSKLGALEDNNILPDVMLDWIRIVKDDGNYAMHDDDRDFDTAEEIEPARQFATTLLHYLFTMPKEVEDARAAIGARKNGDG